MKPMKQPFNLYRGLNLKDGLFLNNDNEAAKVGDVVNLKAFTSCTRNFDYAKEISVSNTRKNKDNTILGENESYHGIMMY